MFDFLDSDWFIIGLEIVFLVFVVVDIRHYMRTKKKQFLVNIVLAIGFALWVLLPYYTKYFDWEPSDRDKVVQNCLDANHSTKLCTCLSNAYFKEYTEKTYYSEQNSHDFQTFTKEETHDCIDDF